jgi:hypothetical protein
MRCVRGSKRAYTGSDTTVATSGTAVSTNAANGNKKRVTADASFTLNAPSNAVDGQRFLWEIKNTHGSNSITVTLASGANAFRYGDYVIAGDLVFAAGDTAYLGCVFNGTDSRWDVIALSVGH